MKYISIKKSCIPWELCIEYTNLLSTFERYQTLLIVASSTWPVYHRRVSARFRVYGLSCTAGRSCSTGSRVAFQNLYERTGHVDRVASRRCASSQVRLRTVFLAEPARWITKNELPWHTIYQRRYCNRGCWPSWNFMQESATYRSRESRLRSEFRVDNAAGRELSLLVCLVRWHLS